MLGAIVGDIVGSPYEYNNIKRKDFELFTDRCFITDDSVLTLAVCHALCQQTSDLQKTAQQSIMDFAWRYAGKDYGDSFRRWMQLPNPTPYNSFGNGAAMRVSPCSLAAKSIDEAKVMSYAVTSVTHNHLEGLKGAEATAVSGFLAKTGQSKQAIEKYINDHYYPMDFSLEEIRPEYQYEVSCQGTVPVALKAFFESDSFEDALRNAVSIGGDSDTIAAITGGVAGFYYGIEEWITQKSLNYLDDYLRQILRAFEKQFA